MPYVQHFRESWTADPFLRDWLSRDPSSRNHAYCKVCRIQLEPKLFILKRHGGSEKHIRTVKSASSSTTMPELFKASTDTQQVTASQRAELILANYIVKENLPLSIFDSLPDVLRHALPDSKIALSIKCHRTKATALVTNCLSTVASEKLSAVLRKQKFTVLADKSTDMASNRVLMIAVCYFDPAQGKSAYAPFDILDVGHEQGNAEGLFCLIKQSFTAHNVPLQNIIGYSSDGEAVMCGGKSSVLTFLKSEVPDLFFMKCLAHSVALVASKACSKLPRTPEELLRFIYNYFKSPKRRDALLEFQHFVNVAPHKLLHPSCTRWLSLHQCVARVLEQWDAVKLYLTSVVSEEPSKPVNEALIQMQNPAVKSVLLFLDFVLPKLTELNLFFQSNLFRIGFAKKESSRLLKTILSFYVDRAIIRTKNLSDIDPSAENQFVELPEVFLPALVNDEIRKLPEPDRLHMISRFRDFYITSCCEITKRLFIEDLSFFDCVIPQQVFQNRGEESLRVAVKRFPSLVKDVDETELFAEWRSLSVNEQDNQNSPEEFWQYIHLSGRYQQVMKFISSLLCLPHGTAEVERLFSLVNLNKNKLRSSLNTKTTKSIITVAKLVPDTGKFEPSAEHHKALRTLYQH